MAASVYFFDREAAMGATLVFGSNAVGWALGRWGLARLESKIPNVRLESYHGLVQWDAFGSCLVFLGFLIVAGFPISPGFVGEDLLLHSTIRIGLWSTTLLAIVFAIEGLALCRVFVRLCFAGTMKSPMEWNWESSQSQHTTPRPFPVPVFKENSAQVAAR
jgi:formate hydrogenlyase subunit 3/multisubunit Na+/H+ antiporter MnhD subunit